jgi:hypothetical protein
VGYGWTVFFFCTDEAWFHLGAYINSQNSRIWRDENQHALHEKSFSFVKDWCLVRNVSKTNRGTTVFFFAETISVANYSIFWLNSLLCWNIMKGTAGFRKIERRPTQRKQEHLSCRTSSVMVMSGVEFGHHDLRTLHHLTSFSKDKESTAMTQEAGRTPTVHLSRAGCCRIKKKNLPEKLQQTLRKCGCFSSRRWDKSAASAVITHCSSHSWCPWQSTNKYSSVLLKFYTVQPLYVVYYWYLLVPCTFITMSTVQLICLSFTKPSKCSLTSAILVTSSRSLHTLFPRNSP